MKDLILQYRELKELEADRDECIKELKEDFERKKSSVLEDYGRIDADIVVLRDRILSEVRESSLRKHELDEATVEMVFRETVEIDDPYRVQAWLEQHDKADLVNAPTFDKRKLNKLAMALNEVSLPQIDGIKIETHEDLRITLND